MPESTQVQATIAERIEITPRLALAGLWNVISSSTNVGVAVVDTRGMFLAMNHPFADMVLGQPNIDAIDMPFSAVEGPEFGDERAETVRNVCQTGQPVLVRQCRRGQLLDTYTAVWETSDSDQRPMQLVQLATPHIAGLGKSVPENVEVFESRFADWGRLSALTKRQIEVLALLREMPSQSEIGVRLGISTKTVETHRDQLIRRLGVRATREAVRLADTAGLTIDRLRSTVSVHQQVAGREHLRTVAR